MSVNLKDINFLDAKKLIIDLEKNSLELMSMLDIASVIGLISKMNATILREEFQSFIIELNKFVEKFEDRKNASVGGIFKESLMTSIESGLEKVSPKNDRKIVAKNISKNNNGHKRKDLRKEAVLNFIKGHNIVSIKDIVPNITGCSEKTVQRELIQLIKDGKIRKMGERRWSKYSAVSRG